MTHPATAPFTAWHAAFDGPVTRSFGIGGESRADGVPSYCRSGSAAGELSFDLSNNRILASLTETGLLRSAAIVTGLVRTTHGGASLRGVPVEKCLAAGGAMGHRPAARRRAGGGASRDRVAGGPPIAGRAMQPPRRNGLPLRRRSRPTSMHAARGIPPTDGASSRGRTATGRSFRDTTARRATWA